MKHQAAVALLRSATGGAEGETWADLGAGTGTFTRALAEIIGPRGHVFAVDADEGALRVLRDRVSPGGEGPEVTVVRADITRPLALPPLDGVLMANVLHFVREGAALVSLAASYLRPGGRLVLVEYEGREPSRWVPYPVSIGRFGELAVGARLAPPEVVATRPSAFGGELYVSVAVRGAGGG